MIANSMFTELKSVAGRCLFWTRSWRIDVQPILMRSMWAWVDEKRRLVAGSAPKDIMLGVRRLLEGLQFAGLDLSGFWGLSKQPPGRVLRVRLSSSRKRLVMTRRLDSLCRQRRQHPQGGRLRSSKSLRGMQHAESALAAQEAEQRK